MNRFSQVVAVFCAMLAPSLLYALATEQLGNGPLRGGLGGESAELLKAVNVSSRVYWYEVNGNPTYFFKGTPKELNEALRHFAAIVADKKEIILRAGAGQTKTFDGKPVAFDWTLHVPMGLHFGGDSDVADTRATLTIYIDVPLPAPPAKPEQVQKWIIELDSNAFKTRDNATQMLVAVGPSSAAMLKDALKVNPSPEARERLERLLAKASAEIRLDTIEFPGGIAVIGVETLVKRSKKEMSNKSPDVRGMAVSALASNIATPEELLPEIEKFVGQEKHEYPLRCAVGAASRLGATAKSLIPILRDQMKAGDDNVKNACQYAIDAIEKAKPETPAPETLRHRDAIRKEIRDFVEKWASKSK